MKLHMPTMRNFRRDEEAVRKLSPEQFRVTQTSGTERPGTGECLPNEEPGNYVDVVSGEPLFASSEKFDSGSGWPSHRDDMEAERCAAYLNQVEDVR